MGVDAPELALLMKSVFIGLSIAAPVGPIGLLCIERTLEHGRFVGLATGLGAAFADAAYGAVGALGLTAIMSLLIGARTVLALAGGAFLVWLGVSTLSKARRVARAGGVDARAGPLGPGRAFATTFVLTLSNPMTIVSFVAVFASLAGAVGTPVPGAPVLMVAGVFVGSAAWWLMLTAVVASARRRLSERVLATVRAASGVLIAGFGVWQLAGGALGS